MGGINPFISARGSLVGHGLGGWLALSQRPAFLYRRYQSPFTSTRPFRSDAHPGRSGDLAPGRFARRVGLSLLARVWLATLQRFNFRVPSPPSFLAPQSK